MVLVCKPLVGPLFAAVLFIIAGKKIRTMILLYCIISTYDMIMLGMQLGLYLYVTLWSFPSLGCYLSEIINNRTHSMRKTGGNTYPHSFTPPLSFRLVRKAFESFQYLWDAQASRIVLFCLLTQFQVLFRVKEVVNNIVQRPLEIIQCFSHRFLSSGTWEGRNDLNE